MKTKCNEVSTVSKKNKKNVNVVKNSIKLLISIGIIACTTSCTVAVVGGAAAAGTATAMDARGGGNVIDDQGLEHKVNNVLSATVPNGSFTVASYAKNILLAGQVPSVADKYKAQTAVDNTSGVRKVWNYLTVGANEDAGAITNDAYLTSSAKTRLIAQKDVNTNNIKVVTSNGVVYLLGHKAGKPHQIRAAIAGIKSISGVKNVVNLIQ